MFQSVLFHSMDKQHPKYAFPFVLREHSVKTPLDNVLIDVPQVHMLILSSTFVWLFVMLPYPSLLILQHKNVYLFVHQFQAYMESSSLLDLLVYLLVQMLAGSL